MVELVKPLQEETLDEIPISADHDRRDQQRRPITEPGIFQIR